MKKYQIIYADPPWNYKVYSKKGLGRSAESHYPTMSIEDICALPVGNLADKDCALFLWVTIPCLLEGLSVLKAWGFTYKTVGFVWVKQNRKADSLFWGMGYWTRSNVELCILATKGHPKRINAAVHQVIVSHIEEHSKKPQEARERILYNQMLLSEKLYPHLLEIDETAQSRLEQMMPQLAKEAGATEELKASDPMKWVGLMNTCKAQAEEILMAELINS